MEKSTYCVVVYENNFLDYHVLLIQIGEHNHEIIDQVSNVSEDMASSFMSTIIESYKLTDDVQIMDKIYVNGQHKKTLYQTIGQFKKVYHMV